MSDGQDNPEGGVSRRNRGNRTQAALLMLGSAEFISRPCALLRSIVVQRTIGPELLGIAAPMLLLADFLERVFSMHPGMAIVQDPKGGSGHFRRTLQTIIGVRGILFGVLIILLAVPLAIFNELNSPMYIAGFMVIGLVPIIRGFAHIDIQRQYRKRQYGGVTKAQVARELGGLLLAVLLCLIVKLMWPGETLPGNAFWIPILVRVGTAGILVYVSFKLARRAFRFGWNSSDAMRILLFLAPLAVAGLIVFLSGQGPRQLVSSAGFLFGQYEFTKLDLGYLTNAIMFATIPATVGGSVIQGSWAPKLSKLRDEPERFRQIFATMQRFSYSLGMAGLVVLSAGNAWIIALFGQDFAPAGPIVCILAYRTAVRLSSAGVRCAMLSLGHSKYVMYMNLGGLLGLFGSAWVIMNGGTLLEIAFWITMGEVLSSVMGNLLITRCTKSLKAWDIWVVPALLLLVGAVIGYFEKSMVVGLNHILVIFISVFIAGCCLVGSMVVFPQIRPKRIKSLKR